MRKFLLYLLLLISLVCVGCEMGNKRLDVDVVVHNYTGEELKSIGYEALDERGEVVSSGAQINAGNSPIKKGEKLYLEIDSDRFILLAEDLNGNKVESAVLRKSDLSTYAKVIKNEAGDIEIITNTERVDLEEIEKFIGFDIPEEVVSIRLVDNHGGFHGDGVTAMEAVALEKDRATFEKKTSKWKDISKMSRALEEFLCPEDGLGGDDTVNEFLLVKPKHGCYKFFDNQEKSSKEKGIFDRYSLNFIVAIYDYDTGAISYVRIDT